MEYLKTNEVAEYLGIRPITLSQIFWGLRHKRQNASKNSVYRELMDNAKIEGRAVFYPRYILENYTARLWSEEDLKYKVLNIITDLLASGIQSRTIAADLGITPHKLNQILNCEQTISFNRANKFLDTIKLKGFYGRDEVARAYNIIL